MACNMYIYIYIYIYSPDPAAQVGGPATRQYGRFPKFHRFLFGPRPWHIEIRHRVKKNIQLICSDLRLSN